MTRKDTAMGRKAGPMPRCGNCAHFSGVVPGEKLNGEPAGYCNHPTKTGKTLNSRKHGRGGLCALHVLNHGAPWPSVGEVKP